MRFGLSRRSRPGPGEAPADELTTAAEEPTVVQPAARRPVPPVVLPRWMQLVLLPLALVGLWALARAAGNVLLILIAASTIALILNPLVRRLNRSGVPRWLAIPVVYIALVAAFAGVGILLANPVSTQVDRFQHNVPGIIDQANHDLADVQSWLNRHGIKVQIQKQGQSALTTLKNDVVKNSSSIVSFTRDLLGKLITLSFELVLVLVLSIYLLVYAGEIGSLARRIMPPGDGTPADDYPLLVQRAVFGYVRGQLLFSIVMGSSAALCLWIIGTIGIFPDGAHYALFFGGFYGVMELVPYIGPILGALPAVLVALFTDPISALWVSLMFLGLQQLEGHVVAPQVFRISLRINPILVILSLLIGFQLYGIAGALLALPVVAVVRETVVYLRRHMVLEPWGTLATIGPAPAAPTGANGPPDPPGSAAPAEGDAMSVADDLEEAETAEEPGVPIPGYGATPD
jgi:predicted PurR-regulated permease PerM